MDERLHDRLYAAVPYIGGVLLAVAAALWSVLDSGERPQVASSRAPVAYSGGGLTLVVVEADWCGWCKRFRRDVAPKYGDSPYASRAPLRYVQLDDQRNAGLQLASHVRAVPTFVLVDGAGREIDRLRGYPGGPDRFFMALDRMLEKAQ